MHDKTVSQSAQKNLFRGKSKQTGKMIFGNLISVPSVNYFCILPQPEDLHPMDVPYLDGEIGTIDGCAVPVYSNTVGQFTGETDLNGVRIFDGDIVDHSAYNFPLVVKWDGGGFELWHDETYIDRLDKYSAPSCVVIGNIHDIPEPPERRKYMNEKSIPAQENESIYVIFYGSPITICGYALSREEAINICEEHHKERPIPRYAYLKIGRLHDGRKEARRI